MGVKSLFQLLYRLFKSGFDSCISMNSLGGSTLVSRQTLSLARLYVASGCCMKWFIAISACSCVCAFKGHYCSMTRLLLGIRAQDLGTENNTIC